VTGILAAAVIFACLYWARAVFVPLAMAIYLTFLLTPVVVVLQRWGLRRVVAVTAVVVLAATLLGGLGWLATRQVTSLAMDLPYYSENIKKKAESLRDLADSPIGKSVERLVSDIAGIWNEPGSEGAEAPATVVLKPGLPAWMERLPAVFTFLLQSLAQAGLAIILVLFMLMKREDLRDRFIRLTGEGHMASTVKAVDDAGRRLSRYLLTQLLINAALGLTVGAGLLLLGVDSPCSGDSWLACFVMFRTLALPSPCVSRLRLVCWDRMAGLSPWR
jgi:predicted PurR-regulated permease PerM